MSQAEAPARAAAADRALPEIHYLRGNLHFARGELDACREEHSAALEVASRLDSPEWRAHALSGLADAQYLDCRYEAFILGVSAEVALGQGNRREALATCIERARLLEPLRLDVRRLFVASNVQRYMRHVPIITRFAVRMRINPAASFRSTHSENSLRAVAIRSQPLLVPSLRHRGGASAGLADVRRGLEIACRIGNRHGDMFALFSIGGCMTEAGRWWTSQLGGGHAYGVAPAPLASRASPAASAASRAERSVSISPRRP